MDTIIVVMALVAFLGLFVSWLVLPHDSPSTAGSPSHGLVEA